MKLRNGYLFYRYIIFQGSVWLRSIIEGFTVRILEKYNTQTMLAIIKAERLHVSLVPQTLKWLMDAGLSQPFSIEKFYLEAPNYHPR